MACGLPESEHFKIDSIQTAGQNTAGRLEYVGRL